VKASKIAEAKTKQQRRPKSRVYRLAGENLKPSRLIWHGAPIQLVIPLMARWLFEKFGEELGKKIIYESFLNIPRLDPKIRYAVNEVLGRSTQQENEKRVQDKALLAVYMIAERKARLKRKGWPRGSGSIDVAALRDTAIQMGMTPAALAKLCRDHGPKGEERRKLQEKAKRMAMQLRPLNEPG
jgi:hypothetical protein